MESPRNRSGQLMGRRFSRRQAVQCGFFGAVGLSLADFLWLEARGEAAGTGMYTAASGSKLTARAKSVIQVSLGGGMAQQESFDPKPEAPVEYRGSFGVVKTKTGDIFSENFPRMAAIADKVTVMRSMVSRVPDHGQAGYLLSTGYMPSAVIDYPTVGSVVSRVLGARGVTPPFIAVPSGGGGPGFLGNAFGPFELNADPGDKGFTRIQDFSIPTGVTPERFGRRQAAREIVEQEIRRLDIATATLDTMDDFYKRAYALLTSADAQKAFSLEGETEETWRLYGREANPGSPNPLAGRLIMARRLVEAGARFITVNYDGWDAHNEIRANCLSRMPALDHAVAGLVTDLDRRGMLDSTLVWVTTEFGRTPKVNANNGRDHWSRVFSMLLAGGGFKQGLVYGASDATSSDPARDAVRVEDLIFTVYHQLGIDAGSELVAFGTRPIEIVKDGRLVADILA